MHYLKLALAVAVGVAVWEKIVKDQMKDSLSEGWQVTAVQAVTIVAVIAVVGMVL